MPSELFGYGKGRPPQNDIGQGLQDLQDMANRIEDRQAQEEADRIQAGIAERSSPRPRAPVVAEPDPEVDVGSPDGSDSSPFMARLREHLGPGQAAPGKVSMDEMATALRRPKRAAHQKSEPFDMTRVDDALVGAGSQLERAVSDVTGDKADLSTYTAALNRNAQERQGRRETDARKAELGVRRAERDEDRTTHAKEYADTLEQRKTEHSDRQAATLESAKARADANRSTDADRDANREERVRHDKESEAILRAGLPIKQAAVDQGAQKIGISEDENLKRHVAAIGKQVDPDASSRLQTFRDLDTLVKTGRTPAGPVKGGFAAWSRDPVAREIVQKAQYLYNPDTKKLAGVSVTDKEREASQIAQGRFRFGGTLQDFKTGLILMRQTLDSSLNRAFSSAPDDAARVFMRNSKLFIRGHEKYGSPKGDKPGSIWSGSPSAAEQRVIDAQGVATQSLTPEQESSARQPPPRASSQEPQAPAMPTSIGVQEPDPGSIGAPQHKTPDAAVRGRLMNPGVMTPVKPSGLKRVRAPNGRTATWDPSFPLPPGFVVVEGSDGG